MKRLNRDMEAVSPVIATILMVAITVVLAATLYMMVGDIGGDDVTTLTGSMTHREDWEFQVVEISPSISSENVEITLLNDTAEVTISEGNGLTDVTWSFLNEDDEIVKDTRFDIGSVNSVTTTFDSPSDVDEIVLNPTEMDGTISYEM